MLASHEHFQFFCWIVRTKKFNIDKLLYWIILPVSVGNFLINNRSYAEFVITRAESGLLARKKAALLYHSFCGGVLLILKGQRMDYSDIHSVFFFYKINLNASQPLRGFMIFQNLLTQFCILPSFDINRGHNQGYIWGLSLSNIGEIKHEGDLLRKFLQS